MNREQLPQLNKNPGSAGNISGEKISAIRFAAEIGKRIQETFPEIAADYINGLTQPELVIKYNIMETFGITSTETARSAVWNALNGYSGRLSDTYIGLITDPELSQTTAKKHQESGSRKVGNFARDTGSGIFGRTSEERQGDKTKGGVSTLKAQVGIHAPDYKAPSLSFETRSVIAQRGAITKGFTLLSAEAKNFIQGLDLSDPKYRVRKGKVNWKKITEEVNERFYAGTDKKTNAVAINSFLRKIKKQNTSKIKS